MSGRRTVNLNKEPFEGRVRKWTRKWVVCDEKGAVSTQQQPGSSKQPRLLRWVQTDERTAEAPARFRHIIPVKDLSLVPGARLGLVASVHAIPPVPAAPAPDPLAADAAALQVLPSSQAQSVAAAVAPAAADVFQQHQQQQQPLIVAQAAAISITDVPTISGPLGASPFQVIAAAAAPPASVDTASLAAAAAAGGASVGGGPSQPSPSGASFGARSGSLDLLPRPGSYADAPTPAAAGPVASDFTAGTDSGMLGRVPLGGVTASDYTGGTDSMDMDGLVGHTQSQGTTSMQQQGGLASVGTLPDTAAGGGSVYGEDESDAEDEEHMEPSDDEQDGGGQFGGLRSTIIAEEEEDFDDAEVVSDEGDVDDDEEGDEQVEEEEEEGDVAADVDDDFDNDEDEDDMPG